MTVALVVIPPARGEDGSRPSVDADAVQFPVGGGVGLVPPRGMKLAKYFTGFVEGDGRIQIVEENGTAPARLKESLEYRTGISLIGKVEQPIRNGELDGFVIHGRTDNDGRKRRQWTMLVSSTNRYCTIFVTLPTNAAITDADVDAALRSVRFRPRPSLSERIAALPYAVDDVGSLRVSDEAGGTSVSLVGASSGDPYDPPAKLTIALLIDPPAGTTIEERAKSALFPERAGELGDLHPDVRSFDGRGGHVVEIDIDGDSDFDKREYFAWFGDGQTIVASGKPRLTSIAGSTDAFRQVLRSLRLRK